MKLLLCDGSVLSKHYCEGIGSFILFNRFLVTCLQNSFYFLVSVFSSDCFFYMSVYFITSGSSILYFGGLLSLCLIHSSENLNIQHNNVHMRL